MMHPASFSAARFGISVSAARKHPAGQGDMRRNLKLQIYIRKILDKKGIRVYK